MRVVVIGGGLAGLSAAITLQERRHRVVLLERRGVLGGRATSMRDAVTGEDVDNGTHLMVAAYRSTLDLVRRAGAGGLLFEQDRLRLEWIGDGGTATLDCPPLVAPLHLLVGLVGLRAPWRVKLDALRLGLAVRLGRRPDGLTLAQYFERCGQSAATRRLLWDPLALAILNESPERAAAVLFHRVYQEAFLSDADASRLVFLRRGWGVLAERLARYLQERGGAVRRGVFAESLELDGGVVGVRTRERPAEREAVAEGAAAVRGFERADAVVCAAPPHALASLLPLEWRARPPFDVLGSFGGSPIVSIELWLDRVIVDRVMVGLREGEMEWLFDKGRLYGRAGAPQHLSFVVSAAARAAGRQNAELVAAAAESLRRCFPAMAGATVTRALVMREPSATFASTPELEPLRPGPVTPIGGLFLAGDWTSTGLPATIEGAVRSGERAARALMDGDQSGRSTSGNERQTGIPQKCSPSVQTGRTRP